MPPALFWQWAFESPPNLKIVVRRALGDVRAPTGHMRLVVAPIVYNAMAARPAARATPLFGALEAALRASTYWPLLLHGDVVGGSDSDGAACLPAADPPLFAGPRDFEATAAKYMTAVRDSLDEAVRPPSDARGGSKRVLRGGSAGASDGAAPLVPLSRPDTPHHGGPSPVPGGRRSPGLGGMGVDGWGALPPGPSSSHQAAMHAAAVAAAAAGSHHDVAARVDALAAELAVVKASLTHVVRALGGGGLAPPPPPPPPPPPCGRPPTRTRKRKRRQRRQLLPPQRTAMGRLRPRPQRPRPRAVAARPPTRHPPSTAYRGGASPTPTCWPPLA